MFNWLYNLLGTMLSFFDSITGSYALALLFYALIFKIVFLPFSIKQQRNQIKMAELTPKIALIRAKYKGRTDQRTMQKQQQEIMELQLRAGTVQTQGGGADLGTFHRQPPFRLSGTEGFAGHDLLQCGP